MKGHVMIIDRRFNQLLRVMIFFVIFFLLHIGTTWGAESASEIVNQFCKMDYNGFRTQASQNDNIYKLMETGKNYVEPGWDAYIVISGYKILKQSQKKDGTLIVAVKYSELAIINSNPGIQKIDKIETVNFTLVKVHNIWKIRDTSGIFPMISKESAKKWINDLYKIVSDESIYQGTSLDINEKNDLLLKFKNISETIDNLK
jgi:hypothetical protein